MQSIVPPDLAWMRAPFLPDIPPQFAGFLLLSLPACGTFTKGDG
jgi:hypothetical protein